MRMLLGLFLFCAHIQPLSAQVDSGETNPIITVDNAYLIQPLFTIPPQLYEALFSEFSQPDHALFLQSDGLVQGEYRFSVDVWNLSTQQITHRITFASGPIFEIWQIPDQSKLVAVEGGGTIYLQDYPDGNIQQKFSSSSLYYLITAVSADGSTLVYTECEWLGAYYGGCDPTSWFLRVYDLNTLEVKNTLYLPHFDVQELALSGDGQYLLVQSVDDYLGIWDTRTSEPIAFDGALCEMDPANRNAIFIDDTTIIVSEETCPGHQVRSWNFVTGEERILFTSPDNRIMHVALSPDTTILGVLAGESAELAQLYLLAFDTGQILTQLETTGYSFDFSPDGRYLVTGLNPGVIFGLKQ